MVHSYRNAPYGAKGIHRPHTKAKCQTVYKPGFVQGFDPSVRPFIWDLARARPLATYPDTPTHKRAVTQRAVPHGVPIRSCSWWGLPCLLPYGRSGGLLPHRFTLTSVIQGSRRRSILCGAIPKALPEGSAPAGLTRHHVCVEPGLSSLAPFQALQERPPDRLTPLSWGKARQGARWQPHARRGRRFRHR